MLYFVYISSIFRKSSIEELSKLAKFRIVDELLSMLIIDCDDKDLQNKVEKTIFTYCVFPIMDKRKIGEKDYLNTILKSIKALKIDKKKGLKMECVDINEKHGYSAKDIEVSTGMKLEKLKYNVNIIDPNVLAYAVLLNGNCYSGYVDYEKLNGKFVNPMRHYHTKKLISRSELKIEQAFDYFKIKGSGIAIDLGAAPGGWSGFLANNGFKVIAIDNGELNYKALSEQGLRVKRADAKKSLDTAKIFKTNDIIHMKAGFRQSKKVLKIKNVDILTDDMNIFCSDTASAIKLYLKYMKKDALFVITVKCLSKNVPNYIERARKMLGKMLKIERIKILPSNRQEITVLATLK